MTVGQRAPGRASQKAPPPASRIDRVRLVLPTVDCPRYLMPFTHLVGTVEGVIGDEVLVCFGEVLLQVPAELLEPAE